jgi:hypothetical protein
MKLREEYQIESGTRSRLFNIYSCDYCGKEYRKQKRLAEGATQEHYCSKTCFTNDTSDRVELECSHCGILFKRPRSKLLSSKSGKYFCCREHKDIGQTYIKEIQPGHYGIGNGIASYREKALRHYGNACTKCGYSNLLALEVHHKDKNRDNNDISNLEVLCCNCHAIEHRG